MTYRQAVQSALDVQDACNLSGVAKSLAGPVMDALWIEARRTEQGSDFINTHPAVYLYLDKLTSLNRAQCLCTINLSNYNKAVAEVEKIIAAETEREAA